MRRLAVLALVVAACTSNGATTTTIDPVPPPPSPEGSTTTTTLIPVPVGPIRATYEGTLPDGTTYAVFIEGIPKEKVTGFGGVVMFEGASGAGAAAVTQISFHPIEGNSYQDGEYRISAGDAGSFVLKFYDQVLEELGPDAESIIQASMTGCNYLGLPCLLLKPPFRWMTSEDQIPAHMEVMYETFVVRQGCGDQAVACNAFHGIQVIPLDQVVQPARRPFEGINVLVSSSAPRPTNDPNYVDSGPLRIRDHADVLWTGEEMIVWGGGSASGAGPRTDGAAFNPTTNSWRVLDGPQLEEFTGSRAIMRRDRMLVITPQSTFIGDPIAGVWEDVGLGYRLENGPMLMIEDDLYAWALAGIAHMDAEFQWSQIPDPGFGGSEPLLGQLLDFGGNLLATGLFSSNCQSRRTSVWSGTEWTELERITFGGCSTANQSAVVQGELLAWSDERDPTYRYNAGDLSWDEDEGVPLPNQEFPPGAIAIGGRMFVPGLGKGAIYDPATRIWTEVTSPGFADSTQMVWTGTEVLAWVDGRDAWRWTPPE
jgi:hypothetical protein